MRRFGAVVHQLAFGGGAQTRQYVCVGPPCSTFASGYPARTGWMPLRTHVVTPSWTTKFAPFRGRTGLVVSVNRSHVMFGRKIGSLWMSKPKRPYSTTIGTIGSVTDWKHTEFSFRCFCCCIGRRRGWYRKTFCIMFRMMN